MRQTTVWGGAVTALGAIALTVAASLTFAAEPRPPMAQAMMSMFDTDQDHMVSQAEIRQHIDTRFDAIDQNHDGELSLDELKNARPDMPMGAGTPSGMAPPDGRGPKGPPPDGKGPGAMRGDRTAMMDARMADRFKAMDTDGNGIVTRDEFQAMESKRFEGLDKNGDGLISQDELAAMPRGPVTP